MGSATVTDSPLTNPNAPPASHLLADPASFHAAKPSSLVSPAERPTLEMRWMPGALTHAMIGWFGAAGVSSLPDDDVGRAR